MSTSPRDPRFSRLSPRLVPGAGPTPCLGALFGEAPGYNEDIDRVPFVGLSGQFLDRCIVWAGESRAGTYVDNIVPYRPPDNRDPTFPEVLASQPRLIRTLQRVRPLVVGAVGKLSARVFLGRAVDLYEDHGCAWWVDNKWLQWKGWVVPIHHPAYGLRTPDMLALTLYDVRMWAEKLEEVRKGAPTRLPILPTVRRDFDHVPAKLKDFQSARGLVGADTEGMYDSPWCSTTSWKTPGRPFDRTKSLMLRRPSSWKKWAKIVKSRSLRLIFHNPPHDIRVMHAMGIEECWDWEYEDTMLLLCLLCHEPLGLKPAVLRWLNTRMMHYDELTDVDEATMLEGWLQQFPLFTLSLLPKPDPVLVDDPKTGRQRLKKPQPLYHRVKNLLKAFSGPKGITAKEIRKRWAAIPEEVFEVAARELPDLTPLLQPPPFSLSDVKDQAAVASYARADATADLELYPILHARCKNLGLLEVYETTRRILPMIARMEHIGIGLSASKLEALDDEWTAEMGVIRRGLEKDYNRGRPFNPTSDAQCRDLLFRRLGWASSRRTAKQQLEAVDEKVLMPLAFKEPAADRILRYRKLETLRSTYARALRKLIDKDGRVHVRIAYTNTASGRLAFRLQQIPSRTVQGRRIRDAFEAKPGCVLISVDLNQIEMRVMADESADKGLIDAYRHNRDVHSETASKMFRLPIDKLDPMRHRYPAKTTGFLIINGGQKYGLHDQFQMAAWEENNPILREFDLDACGGFIDGWLAVYPGVVQMMEDSAQEARRFGYVRDRWGRMRYLPAVGLPADDRSTAKARAEAERQASSLRIQGGAQLLFQRGMVRLWKAIREWQKGGTYVEPLLQIHDEMILEAEEGAKEWIAKETIAIFEEDSPMFRVPIKAKGKWGKTWGSLE